MTPKPVRAARGSASGIRLAIESFLTASSRPTLIDPGELPFELTPGSFHIDERGSLLTLAVWDQTRNYTRKIIGAKPLDKGRVELEIEKFGGKRATITLVDMARPANAHWERRTGRMTGRERLRTSLSRQFPEWRIVDVSSEPDLEHSLSPVCARAYLRKGTTGIAAIAASDSTGASSALTFGLIWLDYLRRREQKCVIEGLVIFVPAGLENDTSLRLRYIDPAAARCQLWISTPDGYEDPVDWRDTGNIHTRVEPRSPVDDITHHPVAGRLMRHGAVQTIDTPGGASFRVNGLEVARFESGKLSFGLEQMRPASGFHWAELDRLATTIASIRCPVNGSPMNPLYQQQPERWLESVVRDALETIDAELAPAPVYGQVPAMAGMSRDILDLVAIDRSGRLAIVELKAEEDIHLPMQALDYWIRVKWHLDRGDFDRQGYFPGIAIRRDAPRLLLVSPALRLHPANETILRFFSSMVDVEQVGISVEWRKELRVVFRARRNDGIRPDQERPARDRESQSGRSPARGRAAPRDKSKCGNA